MSTLRIATTRLEDLQSLAGSGQTGIAAWGVLHALLVRELSPVHAALLAEPVANEAQGTVDWYAEGEGAAARLIDLPDTARTEVQARLDGLTAEIRSLAVRLQGRRADADRLLATALDQALRMPGPEFVHVRGSQPVLVAWAHVRSGPRAGEAALVGQAWRAGAPSTASAAATPSVTLAGGTMSILPPPVSPFQTPPRPAAWKWGGLGISALLGVLALGLLLRDPFDWFNIPVAQCRLEPGQLGLEQGMQEAVAREAVLRTELARLTADAGRQRLMCPPVLAAAPPPTPPPSADARRAEQQGGRTGKVQVILAWDDINDLDLQVICPSGGINFIHRRDCGGTLDLDANGDVAHLTPTPVENVYFEGPAPGIYRVIVDPYGMRQRPSSPYRVTVRRDGQPDLVITGLAQNGQRNRMVTEFTVEPPP